MAGKRRSAGIRPARQRVAALTAVIKSGRPPKSEILKQVDELMPEAAGRGASIRSRKDAPKIATEIVLQTRPQRDIARSYDIKFETLRAFRKQYVTPAVRDFVLSSLEGLAEEAADGTTEVQSLVQDSLIGLTQELRDLYAHAKKILDSHEGDEWLARLGPLVRLLSEQGKQLDRLTNAVYRSKQDAAVVDLGSHPQAVILLEILRTLFITHPEARNEFFKLLQERKLILDVK